jgi:hypothetical protein
MGIEAEKLRVLIPTTSGPVEVLLLTEEDSAIGRCVACIGGTTETADIAAAYHAFVVRPTGVVESLLGHSCYRLDVSGRIDAGSSWQLGVLAAHALHAAGRLAEEKDAATGVLWATGSVRPVDLTVGAVSHVPEKLAGSMERLKQEAAAGRRLLMAMPEQNASELSAAQKADLAASRVEVLALTHVQSLWDKLELKLSQGPRRNAAKTAASRGGPVPPRKRHVRVVAAAAVVLLCIVSGAVYLLGRAPTMVADPAPAWAPPPAQGEANILVPEMVPFLSEREQATIRDVYMPAPDHKALAMSSGDMGFVTGQPDQKTADTAAVATCQNITDERRARNGNTRASRCELYASGDIVVASRGRPPMPPQPWIIRDPSIETPFAVKDVPLVRAYYLKLMEEGFAKAHAPKALAISPTGIYSSYAGETSIEQAIRRSLERCGYNAGAACMIVALDDKFVVPIPRSMKVVGIYRPGAINTVVPELRDEVARRLGGATKGWNAVAIGASGRVGIKLGAESEQVAVDGSMENCVRQDRDCRVAVVGPFLVERSR